MTEQNEKNRIAEITTLVLTGLLLLDIIVFFVGMICDGAGGNGWFTWCIAGLFLWFYLGYIFYVALGFISCGRCLSAIIASYAFVPVFLRRWRSDCCRFCEMHRIAKH